MYVPSSAMHTVSVGSRVFTRH